MSNYEQKDNSGAMFFNERKTQENHPDYMGKVLVDGQVYYVSGWVKTPRDPDKKKYLSLAFSLPKKANPQEVEPAPQQTEIKDSPIQDQEIEDTRLTYDEGYGEPQQDDFNQQVDNFQKQHKTTDEDTEEVPF